MPTTLVLGGARSGKSAYAQAQAEAHAADAGGKLFILVTAQALDAEMQARIEAHRAARGDAWATIEAPVALPSALRSLKPQDIAVVDCLTLWLSNLMHMEADIHAAAEDLTDAIRSTTATVWVVTNEVGQGIVPDNALARRFRDEAGRLNQTVARAVDEAVLISAGLPLRLKG